MIVLIVNGKTGVMEYTVHQITTALYPNLCGCGTHPNISAKSSTSAQEMRKGNGGAGAWFLDYLGFCMSLWSIH